MDLEARMIELGKVVEQHREMLLTEEAAKTALVMPFLQAMGYNVFNPAEVVPEFTADVGLKKGEKVDYAICENGKVKMLVECKPVSVELNLTHAGQLFRYFTVTECRLAVLTNGITYKFYSDIDKPNKMDENPFFVFQLDAMRKSDFRTLSGFTKQSFDVEKIVQEAVNLKMQLLVYNELKRELSDPSDDLVRLVARKIHIGQITTQVRDNFRSLISSSFASLVRDQVTDRLTSALSASQPPEPPIAGAVALEEETVTTDEETEGFQIVRAIVSKSVDPKRIFIRDQKSYCAILLDDNNRKAIARLHFNSATVRYIGIFVGKDETRHAVQDPVDIYKFADALLSRVAELTA